MTARRARTRTFGNVRKLPSGRWQARFHGPDGRHHTARTAANKPLTFDTKKAAEDYLAAQRTAINNGTWTPPDLTTPPPTEVPTFETYARTWIAQRTNRKGQPLAVRTRELYEQLLENRLAPTFGDLPPAEITPPAVRSWYAQQASTPTARAHAYALMRAILTTAVEDGLLGSNPCLVKGGGVTERSRKIRPATLDELGAIVAALPERYRAMALLACWCSLRFGEITALRRADVDLDGRVLRVRQAAAATKSSGIVVKAPKSSAGVRDVTIPPHLVEDLRAHLRDHAQPGRDGLLFPAAGGGHMSASALHKVYRRAREAAGREDLTFHDLRHTGQTYAAAAGANLRELMARAGQSSPGAALRYLHEVDGRQREIADRLAQFATQDPVVLSGSADVATEGETR
ncbi:site-specific integrase [Sporichthya brevicatena]|uniref:Site-specific integrase n=1 Tax=Sporichthya brevicatena TaxID=171442 RepID=A0ABP3S6K9_9ACTN